MFYPTRFDPTMRYRGADPEDKGQILDDLQSAIIEGMRAARSVAKGGPPDVDLLDDYAQALEGMRIGVAHKLLSMSGWLEPTEDEVRTARHLVQLVREGAPSEALIEPARQAARVVTDGWDLERFQSALYCLEDEALCVQHLERIQEVLDLTIALFERGCRAASFVAAPADVANVRHLREIVVPDGAAALAERLRLVQELDGRLPPHSLLDRTDREEIQRFLYLKR